MPWPLQSDDQDVREFSGHRDHRTTVAADLGTIYSPGFRGRLFNIAREHGVGCGIQSTSHIGNTGSGDVDVDRWHESATFAGLWK